MSIGAWKIGLDVFSDLRAIGVPLVDVAGSLPA
jgi:hypothetical protein